MVFELTNEAIHHRIQEVKMQEQVWKEQASAASAAAMVPHNKQLMNDEHHLLGLSSHGVRDNPSLAQVMLHQRQASQRSINQGNSGQPAKNLRDALVRQKSTVSRRASSTDLEEQIRAMQIQERIERMNNRRSSDPEKKSKDIVHVPRQELHRRSSLQETTPSSMTILVPNTPNKSSQPSAMMESASSQQRLQHPLKTRRQSSLSSLLDCHHQNTDEQQQQQQNTPMDSYSHTSRRRRSSLTGSGPGPIPYYPPPSSDHAPHQQHHQDRMALDINNPSIRRSRRGSMNGPVSVGVPSRRGSLQIPAVSGGESVGATTRRSSDSDLNLQQAQRVYLDSLFPKVQIGPKKTEPKTMINPDIGVNPDAGKKKNTLIQTMRSTYVSPFEDDKKKKSKQNKRDRKRDK